MLLNLVAMCDAALKVVDNGYKKKSYDVFVNVNG